MKDKNTEDMVMRDFAGRDPRSAKAWINGGGDGRNERFAEFAKRKGRSEGDQVEHEFIDHARGTEGYDPNRVVELYEIRTETASKQSLAGKLFVPVIGLAIGAWIAASFST